MKRTNELGKGRRVSVGPDGRPGGPKPPRHGTFGRASDVRRKRGLLGEGGDRARGRMGHDVGNVGRDGSLVGSDRGDAGSLDAVAA